MHIVLPHTFSKSEAVQRVKQALDQARPQLSGKATIEQEEWQGDTLRFAFNAEGQAVSGTFAVEDRQFVLDAKLPFMMRLFEGKIEKMIAEQAGKMLG